MDNTCTDGNLINNNSSEMEDEFDDKVSVYETLINGELYDTNNKHRGIHNYVAIKDEEMDDQTVVSLVIEKPCETEYKQGTIYENMGDMTVVKRETEFIACTDNKLCPNETLISEVYIKQEPCDIKTEQGNIQNYLSIKDENMDDLTVGVQETELMTDHIDNKVCVYETIISGGYIKDEPCDTGDESGSTHDNVNMKDCEECGVEYDLYCLKCPMLIRIFDSNNPDGTDNSVRRTLPKKFLDMCETRSGTGIVALRAIPKGVVFGPFKGLDSIKDEVISKWILKYNELAVTKHPEWFNWMQYIRRADKSSCQNLVPFQYEGGLYYRSNCHINVGDELLVRWDSDTEGSEIQGMENSNWEARFYGSLDNSYACTFCCVGYKSIHHLKAHNSTCVEKRNNKDFCKEIVKCDVCKIYLDKKEYSDYHMDRCNKNNEKSVFNSRCRRNRGRSLRKDDRPFWCTLCPYRATTKSNLKQHIVIHTGDKPFACTLCPYRTTANGILKRHMAFHNNYRPFACTLCPHKATTKSNLKQHIAIHTGDQQFACTVCPYKTTTNSILKRHMAVHNDDRPFACTLCPYKTKTKSNLNQHIAIHNDDKLFACTLCPHKATTKSNLKQHIAIHNGDKPFACTLCPYKTTTNGILKRHMTVHNDDRPFACTLCSYKTTTKWNLNQHIAIHNDDKLFACTLCPHKTTTKSNLKQHIKIHNNDKPFACTLCPYNTTTNYSLKQHMTVHNDDRPFACALCSYKTAIKSNLKQHIASHNGDKPFACSLCPYKTTSNCSLKRHMALHNGDKPFACALCPYKTKTKSNLKQHIAIHSGDKPFACALCPYKTKTKSNLKQHIAIHNGDKPFACTLCPYKTKTKSYLRKHIAIHNGDKP